MKDSLHSAMFPKSFSVRLTQEYVEHGPLLPESVVVQCLPTDHARDIFVGCIRGLHHLHQHGVVHGDIKPQNLLVGQGGIVKISDFGAAVMLQHEVRCAPGGIGCRFGPSLGFGSVVGSGFCSNFRLRCMIKSRLQFRFRRWFRFRL